MTESRTTQRATNGPEVFTSIDQVLARYFPGCNPRVEKAVMALAGLTPNEYEDVLRKVDQVRRWRAA